MYIDPVWTVILRWNQQPNTVCVTVSIPPTGTSTSESGTFLEVNGQHGMQFAGVSCYPAYTAAAFTGWILQSLGI